MKKPINNSGNTRIKPGNSRNFSLLETKLRKMVREELMKENEMGDIERKVFDILRKYMDAGKATQCAIEIGDLINEIGAEIYNRNNPDY